MGNQEKVPLGAFLESFYCVLSELNRGQGSAPSGAFKRIPLQEAFYLIKQRSLVCFNSWTFRRCERVTPSCTRPENFPITFSNKFPREFLEMLEKMFETLDIADIDRNFIVFSQYHTRDVRFMFRLLTTVFLGEDKHAMKLSFDNWNFFNPHFKLLL